VRVTIVAGVRNDETTGDNERQRGGAGVDVTDGLCYCTFP
jgi:hypothetical protein